MDLYYQVELSLLIGSLFLGVPSGVMIAVIYRALQSADKKVTLKKTDFGYGVLLGLLLWYIMPWLCCKY